jgi:hypothetical protein
MIDIIGTIGGIIGQVLPDTKAKDKAMAELELRRLEIEAKVQEAITSQNLGQIEINKVEAGSNNLFVSGWRPFIGWSCGFALVFSFIIAPIMTWAINLFGINIELPTLDTAQLMQLILAMLGMAGLRTYEKKNYVQGKH